jgi:spore germination cell wall hydrolase CwlJ-like protein
MQAIAWVVLNRRNDARFPDTICKLVRQGGEDSPCQFAYWCDGAADIPKNNQGWERARKIAAEMLENPPPDPTGGARFCHSEDIAPPWTKKRRRTTRVGRFIFCR